MDQKTKYKIADRNKKDMLLTAERILDIVSHDKVSTLKVIEKFKKEKEKFVCEQKYEKAAIARGKELTLTELVDSMDSVEMITEVRDLLEDAIFFEFAPKQILDLCSIIIAKRVEDEKKHKNMSMYDRRLNMCFHLAHKIREYTSYKFFFLGGGISEHRTLYAMSHKEAWKKANDYCVEAFEGNVRGILCLMKDGKDIGTLSNLQSMFEPKDPDKKIHSVRATDLIPEYKYEGSYDA